jgi:methylthioribose-1-phosphate isomerase
MPGYSSGQTTVLDTITRICKNSDSVALAIQEINVRAATISTVNRAGMSLVTASSLSTDRFKRTGTVKLASTTFLNTQSANRAITSVEVSGRFDSFTKDGDQDVETVTYSGDDVVNDLVFGINNIPGVIRVGDDA